MLKLSYILTLITKGLTCKSDWRSHIQYALEEGNIENIIKSEEGTRVGYKATEYQYTSLSNISLEHS